MAINQYGAVDGLDTQRRTAVVMRGALGIGTVDIASMVAERIDDPFMGRHRDHHPLAMRVRISRSLSSAIWMSDNASGSIPCSMTLRTICRSTGEGKASTSTDS